MVLSYSDNSAAPSLSDWPMRVALGVIAVGGTLAYTASFRAVPRVDWIVGAGACIGLAAGLAWLFFGGVLLLVAGARPSALAWADACLRTMATGILVLMPAAVLNVNAESVTSSTDDGGLWFFAGTHLVLLAAANAVMLAKFLREARALGLYGPTALTLWMLALNGSFAVILMFLYWIGAV
jgi:hypothetical protein